MAIHKNLGWSLRDIDETNFENLVSFINHIKAENSEGKYPKRKTFNGEVYELSDEPPPWL